MVTVRQLVLRAWAALLIVFMLAPIALVILFSFSSNALINFPLGDITLKWYVELYEWPAFAQALGNSMTIAGTVALISTAIGTMAALALARIPGRYSGGATLALCCPIMFPGLVIGIVLLSFYVSIGLELSLLTVILSHLVVTQPYVILVVYARMATFDYAVIESARDLGATPVQAFLTVTLPIIRTALIGGALLATAYSVDDFIVTFFTIGGGNTLPTLVWGMIRTTLDPRVNAIATILIVVTVTSTVIALKLSRYRG